MSFNKQSITWSKFYWWIWSDDQLVGASQILYSENIDLKSNSRYAQLNMKPLQKVLTWTDTIAWFINAIQDTWSKKTYWYWKNGVVYQVDWTDNVPNYTINAWADDVVNAIDFNDKTYFLLETSSFSNVALWEIISDNLYDWIWTITNTINTSSKWTPLDKYPMYNYLDSFMYIWIGKEVYRLDNLWVAKTFNIWTDDIVAITQLWWVFRLYQRDWRILFWDGLNDAIDSSTSVNDTIRSVVQHKWVDYIVWWVSKFFSNFYVMNWYRADLLVQAETTEATNWDNAKFNIIDATKNIISFNWQIIFWAINVNVDQIYSFGNKKPQFPVWYENVITKSPDDLEVSNIFGIWIWESDGSYYVWYNDGVKDWIFEYNIVSASPTYQHTWVLYTPVFNAGANTIKKQIESIWVYVDIPFWTTATLKLSIDWWTYWNTTTLTYWRNIINTITNEFFEIIYEISFTSTWTNTPKLYDMNLIYTVIEQQ